jgi:hypothetical protein
LSDYDPTLDPRYIPGVSEIPLQDKERMEDRLRFLEQSIEAFDQSLVMFQHEGWETLIRGFDSLVAELDRVLRSEKDLGSWKFYRGQLAQVEWFQSLPEDMAKRQLQARREHAQLLRDLGRE